MTVIETFQRIEEEMTRLRHRAPLLLRPGIPWRDLKDALPGELPDEVRDLYALHDGSATFGETLGHLWIMPTRET